MELWERILGLECSDNRGGTMLNFYDFEVFKHDWMVVIINPIERKETVIVNSREELKDYYENHKKQIWLGYNSRNYDTYILKGILCGFDPYDISHFIIVKGLKGWQYSNLLRNVQLYDYDCMDKMRSLKQLEAFMGNNIKETSVPFDIDRKLTDAEIAQTVKYCTHDVEQLMEVFGETKADFDAHLDLIKTFNLPMECISKTQAQLTAMIIGCHKKVRYDEWDLEFVDNLRLKKYAYVLDWFKDKKNQDYDKKLETEVCGIPHTFAWGGLHGCPSKPIHRKGCIIHVDVTSFYPSIMIEYNLLTRNCKTPEKFKEIYDKRVALKKAGKKKEQAPYKIILNSTYGICKDSYSQAYDPRQANNVCINGQLLLLDLLEHLEGHCEVLQSNTDGLIIQIPDTDEAFDRIDDICWEWEKRTHMGLGFDYIDEIYQKDVNNYIFRFDNGKLERKGSYVKELSRLDNDLPIVNEALVQRMANNVPVEKTINDCTDLIKFQKVVKVSSKYAYGWHNGKVLTDKTHRVFASKDQMDTYIGKCKGEGMTVEKFANTPDHCFIINEDVRNLSIPKKLDRQYYIDLATKRLADYGVTK